MQWFLDISLALIIFVTIMTNWRKGFIRSVLGTAKSIIAVVLTFMFGSRASAWLEEHVIGDRITNYVHERVGAMFEEGAATFDLSHVFENLPTWLTTMMEKTDTTHTEAGLDFAHMTEADATALYEMADALAEPISSAVSSFIGHAVVFLGSLLVLTVLAYILGKIADLPVLKTCDRAMGLLLGILCAVLYASAYTLLLFGLLSLIEGASETVRFHDAFEATYLFRRVYEWNVFRWIFGLG